MFGRKSLADLNAEKPLADVFFALDKSALQDDGRAALQKNADLRLDIVHDRSRLDEWTWNLNGVPFAFSDNTTVTMKPDQRVTYVSLAYTLRFR